MACQATHAFGQIEGAALAHPVTEEIKTETRIAQIHEMSTGVGQRDHASLVPDQWLDALVDCVEKAADKAGIEVFLKTEIEHRVEWVAISAAHEVGNRAVGEPSVLRLHRGSDDDPVPIALEYGSGFRVLQVGTKRVAEALVAERGLELLAVRGLDRIERRMAVERIGAGQGEVERQRLAGDLDIEFVAARLCRGAIVEHAKGTIWVLLVVERDRGAHEDTPAMPRSNRLHAVRHDRSRRDLDYPATRSTHRSDERIEFRDVADRRRHRHAAPARMVERV